MIHLFLLLFCCWGLNQGSCLDNMLDTLPWRGIPSLLLTLNVIYTICVLSQRPTHIQTLLERCACYLPLVICKSCLGQPFEGFPPAVEFPRLCGSGSER